MKKNKFKFLNKGAIGEATFIRRCLEQGLHPNIPYEDILAYDVIVEGHKRSMRVQVKASTAHRKASKYTAKYRVDCRKCFIKNNAKRRYTKEDTDFLAIYLMEDDIFYIIPVEDFKGFTAVIYPYEQKGKYKKYQEAWHLLKDALSNDES